MSRSAKDLLDVLEFQGLVEMLALLSNAGAGRSCNLLCSLHSPLGRPYPLVRIGLVLQLELLHSVLDHAATARSCTFHRARRVECGIHPLALGLVGFGAAFEFALRGRGEGSREDGIIKSTAILLGLVVRK
jgi:hypothetical protein